MIGGTEYFGGLAAKARTAADKLRALFPDDPTARLLIDMADSVVGLDQILQGVREVAMQYVPDALPGNSLAQLVDGIGRQRDAQREIKDHLADTARQLTGERDTLREQLRFAIIEIEELRDRL